MLRYGSTSRTCGTRSDQRCHRSSVRFRLRHLREGRRRWFEVWRSRRCRRKPRSFFDKLNDWAKSRARRASATSSSKTEGGKGPVASNHRRVPRIAKLREAAGVKDGDTCSSLATRLAAAKFAGDGPHRLGEELNPSIRSVSSSAGSSIS